MAVEWDKYHIAYNPTGIKVVLRRMNDAGKTKWESEDRTEEAVLAVMRKMQQEVHRKNTNGKRPWFGYRLEGVGQLIFIEGDYQFKITGSPVINRKKT